jgi:hypothetical protein
MIIKSLLGSYFELTISVVWDRNFSIGASLYIYIMNNEFLIKNVRPNGSLQNQGQALDM